MLKPEHYGKYCFVVLFFFFFLLSDRWLTLADGHRVSWQWKKKGYNNRQKFKFLKAQYRNKWYSRVFVSAPFSRPPCSQRQPYFCSVDAKTAATSGRLKKILWHVVLRSIGNSCRHVSNRWTEEEKRKEKKTTTKINTSCVCVHTSASRFRLRFSLSLRCDHFDHLSLILTREKEKKKNKHVLACGLPRGRAFHAMMTWWRYTGCLACFWVKADSDTMKLKKKI